MIEDDVKEHLPSPVQHVGCGRRLCRAGKDQQTVIPAHIFAFLLISPSYVQKLILAGNIEIRDLVRKHLVHYG